MLNLIQSNTSNFRNFVELQLTSHILKKQVFNTVPGDVIKVSNLFGEVNQFEKHNIFGLGVFHQFSSFVTPDLVFNEVRGGKFALLPPRCPRIGWGGGDLEEFLKFLRAWRIYITELDANFHCWHFFGSILQSFKNCFNWILVVWERPTALSISENYWIAWKAFNRSGDFVENLNILKPLDDCCFGEKISVLKMQYLHTRHKKVDWRYF